MKTTPSDCGLRRLFCGVTCLCVVLQSELQPHLFFFFSIPVCDMTLDLDSDYRCLSAPAISLSLAADPLLALFISCPSKCLTTLTRPVSLLDQRLNSLSFLRPPSSTFLLTSFFVISPSLLTVRLQQKK